MCVCVLYIYMLYMYIHTYKMYIHTTIPKYVMHIHIQLDMCMYIFLLLSVRNDSYKD